MPDRWRYRILFLLLDKRTETIAVHHRPSRIDQVRGIEVRLKIKIQKRPPPRREYQRVQKFLSQPLAAENIKIAIAYAHRRNRHQTERRSILRVHSHQKRTSGRPIRSLDRK